MHAVRCRVERRVVQIWDFWNNDKELTAATTISVATGPLKTFLQKQQTERGTEVSNKPRVLCSSTVPPPMHAAALCPLCRMRGALIRSLPWPCGVRPQRLLSKWTDKPGSKKKKNERRVFETSAKNPDLEPATEAEIQDIRCRSPAGGPSRVLHREAARACEALVFHNKHCSFFSSPPRFNWPDYIKSIATFRNVSDDPTWDPK